MQIQKEAIVHSLSPRDERDKNNDKNNKLADNNVNSNAFACDFSRKNEEPEQSKGKTKVKKRNERVPFIIKSFFFLFLFVELEKAYCHRCMFVTKVQVSLIKMRVHPK